MDHFYHSGRDRRSGPLNDEQSLVGLYCRGGKLAALPSPACKPLQAASAITTGECASTTTTTPETKAAWPLFMGGDLPCFPVKVRHQRSATVSATTASYPPAEDSNSPSALGYEASVSSYSYSSRSSSCSSPSSLSFGSSSLDELEESFLKYAKLPTLRHQASSSSSSSSTAYSSSWSEDRGSCPQHRATRPPPAHVLMNGKSPLLEIGADVMANILTFLEPPEILRVLTMPLSKEWKQTVSSQQELWRVLCLVAPFKANVQSTGQSDSDDDNDDDDDDDSFCSVLDAENDVDDIFGKYRIMYTSFVRCVKYLALIKEDAENGRPPSAIAYDKAGGGFPHAFGVSKSLKKFLAKSRGVSESPSLVLMGQEATASSQPIGVADDGTSSLSATTDTENSRKVRDESFARLVVSTFFLSKVLKVILLCFHLSPTALCHR
jgi:hypothetical protein